MKNILIKAKHLMIVTACAVLGCMMASNAQAQSEGGQLLEVCSAKLTWTSSCTSTGGTCSYTLTCNYCCMPALFGTCSGGGTITNTYVVNCVEDPTGSGNYVCTGGNFECGFREL